MLATFADLLALLERGDNRMQVDSEHQRVAVPTRRSDLPGELGIVWDPRHTIVQCIYPLPFQVPADRIGLLADAITRINHALVLPGFGLDHANRLAYCRIAAPRREDGTLTPGELDRLITATLRTAGDFLQTLQEVVAGTTTPEDALSRAASLRQHQRAN